MSRIERPKALPVTHLGFFSDDVAKCGARSMSRATRPDLVTCSRCLASLAPGELLPKEVQVLLRVRADHLELVERLAAIAGKDPKDHLGVLLSEILTQKVEEWRGVLLPEARTA